MQDNTGLSRENEVKKMRIIHISVDLVSKKTHSNILSYIQVIIYEKLFSETMHTI